MNSLKPADKTNTHHTKRATLYNQLKIKKRINTNTLSPEVTVYFSFIRGRQISSTS